MMRTNKLAFTELAKLFVPDSEHTSILDRSVGKGYIESFYPEKGLKAMLWNCSFNERTELYTDGNGVTESTYFTIACFPCTEGLQPGSSEIPPKENIVWDTFLLSARSNYTMIVSPLVNCQCLTISFSRSWFIDMVQGNEELQLLRDRVLSADFFYLLDCMNAPVRKLVHELLQTSWKQSLGSFYIKSVVLQIVCDFFYKLKEDSRVFSKKLNFGTTITEVERYLSSHLNGPLPNLKDLAATLAVSEATLKRHFKQKYGVNMSVYFRKKKMEYAHHLLKEQKLNLTETAKILGYRNLNQFLSMFNKYPAHGSRFQSS